MKPIVILSILAAFSMSVSADWHSGKIAIILIGYDGKTVAIGQEGATKTDCTCYPAWPNRYCLNRARESFKEEYALLLSVKARGISVALNINEETCEIKAMYEL